MIYFLYGTDSYRIREKEQELLAQFLAGDKSGINLERIDGTEMSAGRFEQAVSAVSFFSTNKVVVIENLLTQNKDSELKGKIAEKIKKELSVKILFVEHGEPDKREKLFKALVKPIRHSRPDRESTNSLSVDPRLRGDDRKEGSDDKTGVFYFGPLSDFELRQWINSAVKKRNFKIDRAATEALAVAVGANLWRLTNEIEKLILYVKSQKVKISRPDQSVGTRNDGGGEQNRDQIELQDIQEMVVSDFNPNVFNFIESIATANKKQSVKLLQQFLNNGENEIYLLSMIIYQFRTLIKIKDLLDRGTPSGAVASQAKISPYVVQKSLPVLRHYSLQDLISYYQKLYEFDVKIKTGRIEAKVAVDLLVAG